MTPTSSAQELRDELMAAEAFTRVKALHALECAATLAPSAALARDLEDFVSRGIPYYAAADTHYLAWVDKAVAYWERLHQPAGANVQRLSTRKRTAAPAGAHAHAA